jgi:hypothetical protein
MESCRYSSVSSRTCEYGTRGCTVNHTEAERLFFEEIERIAKSVDEWPEWKKEGWAILDRRDRSIFDYE